MAITSSHLLTVLTREELDELTATAIEQGQTDPITQAIAGALAEINLYVDPHVISDDLLNRLWIALTVPLLYQRHSTLPEKHTKERDWARGLLVDIRDGKFPNLTIDTTAVPTGRSAWGSSEKIS